ncbi:hypothetical protein DDB_G0283179 [Dictyostelium discoideum AX4]|uniref:Uncharacterized protein n=1 Tax=Dictyostelium discoideum TaxID=44689 RepID=Q54RE4_DICDI|nr:hypothetical protein DDB_G0283179 [Dictyostelium discoideum AX4]EAL65828.1 hypothetical protein DDB_G0283179 [Dictyostelium discoideum AX4]|eukprot:XP_639201.1 hypothetical protein DDB_G0283179 [Dictyostelium discoideum AX4]
MIFTSLTKFLNNSSSSSALNKNFDINSKSIVINFEKLNIQGVSILKSLLGNQSGTSIKNNPLGNQGGIDKY